MAEGKKSFVAYCEWQETFDMLTDEEAGRLAKHLFAYVNDENPDTDDRLLRIAFEPIKLQLKRDLRKYEEKCGFHGKDAHGLTGAPPFAHRCGPVRHSHRRGCASGHGDAVLRYSEADEQRVSFIRREHGLCVFRPGAFAPG